MFDQTPPYDLGENTAWSAIARTADLLAMVGGSWVVGRGVGQPGSIIGITPGTRSGAKLYFQKNGTAIFDQTRPMAEREAFGERASQTSSIGEEQMRLLRLGQDER